MGISSVMSKSLMSASSSMKIAQVQHGVKTKMDGQAGVLRAQIKRDEGKANVEKKKEQLADIEEKSAKVNTSTMNTLSDMNNEMKQAAKEDQEITRAEERSEKKKAEKAMEQKRAEKAAAKKKAEKKAQEEKLEKATKTKAATETEKDTDGTVVIKKEDTSTENTSLETDYDQPVSGEMSRLAGESGPDETGMDSSPAAKPISVDVLTDGIIPKTEQTTSIGGKVDVRT